MPYVSGPAGAKKGPGGKCGKTKHWKNANFIIRCLITKYD